MTDHFSGAVTAPAERAAPTETAPDSARDAWIQTQDGDDRPRGAGRFSLGSRGAQIKLKKQKRGGRKVELPGLKVLYIKK